MGVGSQQLDHDALQRDVHAERYLALRTNPKRSARAVRQGMDGAGSNTNVAGAFVGADVLTLGFEFGCSVQTTDRSLPTECSIEI